MEEIQSPDNRSEFVEWLDTWISKFTENDGWGGSVYYLTVRDARGYILMFCPERIGLIPAPEFQSCVGDEVLETYRQTTIAWFTKLRDAIDPESAEGPIPPNRLKIGSCETIVPPTSWFALQFMWNKTEVSETVFCKSVWRDSLKSKSAVSGCLNKANDALGKVKSSRKLSLKNGKVLWKQSE